MQRAKQIIDFFGYFFANRATSYVANHIIYINITDKNCLCLNFFSATWTLLHIYSLLLLVLKHAWTRLLAKCLVWKKGSSGVKVLLCSAMR